MPTRFHSISLSLCLASAAGCGAPTGDAAGLSLGQPASVGFSSGVYAVPGVR